MHAGSGEPPPAKGQTVDMPKGKPPPEGQGGALEMITVEGGNQLLPEHTCPVEAVVIAMPGITVETEPAKGGGAAHRALPPSSW